MHAGTGARAAMRGARRRPPVAVAIEPAGAESETNAHCGALKRLGDEIDERARAWTNESEAAILEEIAEAAHAAARTPGAD